MLTMNVSLGQALVAVAQPSWLAIQRGPVVLARDARLAGEADVDGTITPVFTEDGFVPLEIVKQNDKGNIWMSFSIPCLAGFWRLGENTKTVYLYSSAGNTFSEASRYRIWFPQLLDVTGKGYVVN